MGGPIGIAVARVHIVEKSDWRRASWNAWGTRHCRLRRTGTRMRCSTQPATRQQWQRAWPTSGAAED